MKTKYPECEKLKAVSAESQSQGTFLDWLIQEKEITLCEWKVIEGCDELWPISRNIESLLAEYHGIDLNKVEEERREMLEELRVTK